MYIYIHIFFFSFASRKTIILSSYIYLLIYIFFLSPRERPPPPADERVYARYNPQALQPNQASDCSPAYREQELKHPRPWRTTTQGFLLVCFAPRRPSVCLRPQPQTPEEATPPSEFSCVRVFFFSPSFGWLPSPSFGLLPAKHRFDPSLCFVFRWRASYAPPQQNFFFAQAF